MWVSGRPTRVALLILIASVAALAEPKIYSFEELDELSRKELVQLVLDIQKTDQIDTSDGSCSADNCPQAENEISAAHKAEGRNDLFDNYDAVYPGLWVADPDAAQEFFPLNALSQPSANKSRLEVEHTQIWAAARQKEQALTPEEQVEYDRGYERNGFNQFISDRLPLRRRGPDTRPIACKGVKYPAINFMPKTSVIVVFFNEARSTLLRTAWSIVDRTPPELLQEIILVDDGSEFDHLYPENLDADVAEIPKTRVLRLPERVGLIRAKVRGVEVAKGDAVAFMDSHCEVNDGWLEPLLAEVVRNPRAVALPLVDAIDFDTHEVKPAIAEIGVFSWSLYFYWLPEPTNKLTPENQVHHTYRSPMMAGGLFVMGREFFLQSGAYDEDMDTWGGENFEMSFRLWMCGGELITVPCSHIAHAFRKKTPYKFKNRDPLKTIAHNLNRVAAVWMDSHATFYHNMSGNLIKSPTFGDVTARLALRDRLKCKSFDWYLNNVGKIHDFFVPKAENYLSAGLLRNEHTQECLYHEGNPDGERILAVMRSCHGPAMSEEGPEALHWFLTRTPYHGELRHEATYGSRCLMAHEIKNKARLELVRCYDHETPEGRLRWKYDKDTKQLSLVNFPTGCLAASKTHADQVIVSKCKGDLRQQWTFVPWDRRPS